MLGIHATYAPNCICIQISVFYFILQFIFHINNIIASLSDYLGLHLIFDSFPTNDVRNGEIKVATKPYERLRRCLRISKKKLTSVGEYPGEHELLFLDKPLN